MLPARTLKAVSRAAVILATQEMASHVRLKAVPKTAAQPVESLILCRIVTINVPRLLSVSLSPKKLPRPSIQQLLLNTVQLTEQWSTYQHPRTRLKICGTIAICMLIIKQPVRGHSSPMVIYRFGLELMMRTLKAEVINGVFGKKKKNLFRG